MDAKGATKLYDKMVRFKKGETTNESFNVIMHDLECLELAKSKNNDYHYQLLKKNLADIFGEKDDKTVIEELSENEKIATVDGDADTINRPMNKIRFCLIKLKGGKINTKNGTIL